MAIQDCYTEEPRVKDLSRTCRIDVCLDQVEDSLKDDVYFWEHLTREEIHEIQDEKDIPIFSVIKGLTPQQRETLYRVLKPIKVDGQYMKEQGHWMQDSEYYCGRTLGGSPKEINPEVMCNEALKQAQRYRLYYLVKHESELVIDSKAKKEDLDLVTKFVLSIKNYSDLFLRLLVQDRETSFMGDFMSGRRE